MVSDPLPLEQFFEEGYGGQQPPKNNQSKRAKKKAAQRASNEARNAKRHPRPNGPLVPRSDAQQRYIDSLSTNTLTFGIGSFGAGKTYIPARVFGEWLARGDIQKLYVARPNVSKKQHENGFLPGTLEDKTAPWLVPIFEGLQDAMGRSMFEEFRRTKKIEEVPFEFIQGRTFKDAACIVDEAENLDFDDLYILLGRQGENLSMCLAGDAQQSRIKHSGLAKVVEMATWPEMESNGVVTFTSDDVVRSAQAKQWAKAFEKALKGTEKASRDTGCGFHANTAPAFLKVDLV